MSIENRHGFFPRNYKIQPIRYLQVYDAWGAVFVAPNNEEYLIALHISNESMQKAIVRGMQQGRQPYGVQRNKVVSGFQVFRIHKNHPLQAMTQILPSINHAVKFLEGRFKSMTR